MVWIIGALYEVGLFVLGGFTLYKAVGVVREEPAAVVTPSRYVVLGLVVYFSGWYLRNHLESPSTVLFWVPAISGAACGVLVHFYVDVPTRTGRAILRRLEADTERTHVPASGVEVPARHVG